MVASSGGGGGGGGGERESKYGMKEPNGTWPLVV